MERRAVAGAASAGIAVARFISFYRRRLRGGCWRCGGCRRAWARGGGGLASFSCQLLTPAATCFHPGPYTLPFRVRKEWLPHTRERGRRNFPTLLAVCCVVSAGPYAKRRHLWLPARLDPSTLYARDFYRGSNLYGRRRNAGGRRSAGIGRCSGARRWHPQGARVYILLYYLLGLSFTLRRAITSARGSACAYEEDGVLASTCGMAYRTLPRHRVDDKRGEEKTGRAAFPVVKLVKYGMAIVVGRMALRDLVKSRRRARA